MAGKITCFLDCVSPYSYFALLYIEKHRNLLAAHNIAIDIVPVFLGGINVGSGNKPPWTLPAKGAYSSFDSARAKRYFGVPNIKTPDFFPILSLFPQRVLVYLKEAHEPKFIAVFLNIFSAMWENGIDVSKPELLTDLLTSHFEEHQVEDILTQATSPVYKQRLNDNTKRALEYGAFGCPWFWVKNAQGAEEPFFGSDRFHFMWEYLGLPWTDLHLLPPTAKAKI